MIIVYIYRRLKNIFLAHIKEIHFLLKNRHNNTKLHGMNYPHFDDTKVKVGKRSYGKINVYMFGNQAESLVVGNYCSIGPNCVFLLSGEHDIDKFTTFPTETLILKQFVPPKCKGPIIVEDDVWIGYGVTILSGVHIGQGAVIGAGAVVVKDIPAYSIVAGNPAKIIRMRFSAEIIEKLKKYNFSKIDESALLDLNREKIRKGNIDNILSRIKNN